MGPSTQLGVQILQPQGLVVSRQNPPEPLLVTPLAVRRKEVPCAPDTDSRVTTPPGHASGITDMGQHSGEHH